MTASSVGYAAIPHGKATFNSIYSRLALYATILQVYTKPLFSWRKALTMSHDGRTLYEFAKHTPQNTEMLHTALVRNEFHFREGIDRANNVVALPPAHRASTVSKVEPTQSEYFQTCQP